MTYEYMSGMGRGDFSDMLQSALLPPAAPSSGESPIYMGGSGPGYPSPPPAPTRPVAWRGNFDNCKQNGGTAAWSSGSSWLADVIGSRDEELYWAPQINRDGASPPSVVGSRVTSCYNSGLTRQTAQAPNASGALSIAQRLLSESERCCYPAPFIQRQQAEYDAEMTAYQVSLEAYRNSPAYKDYLKKVQEYRDLQLYASGMQQRARSLALMQSTSIPGSPCSPPEGGVVGKFPYPVPRTDLERAEQQVATMRLQASGCSNDGRLFDMENMEVCCPPGVQVGPPAPVEPVPVAPAATETETTYFGFTATQLMFAGLGGAAIYMLLSMKR